MKIYTYLLHSIRHIHRIILVYRKETLSEGGFHFFFFFPVIRNTCIHTCIRGFVIPPCVLQCFPVASVLPRIIKAGCDDVCDSQARIGFGPGLRTAMREYMHTATCCWNTQRHTSDTPRSVKTNQKRKRIVATTIFLHWKIHPTRYISLFTSPSTQPRFCHNQQTQERSKTSNTPPHSKNRK